MFLRPGVYAVICAALLCGVANAATIEDATVNGWQTRRMKTDLLTVDIAPQLGGRIIQVRLGDHDFFWNNPDLKGQGPTETGLGPDKSWLNYGGSKLWPAPQGWSNPETEWPGPPGAVLDGQPHDVTASNDKGDSVSVTMVSRKDPQTGVQFSKTVTVGNGAAHVALDHQMTNIDTKPRRWSIWQVTQIDATATSASGFNNQLSVYCPANPDSRFPKGYQELFGIVNNPNFRREPGTNLIVSTFDYLVGKIGTDTRAGWQAIVDANVGYTLVERFTVIPGAEYPGGDTTEIWMNGPGHFYAGGKVAESPNDVKKTPPYLETELLAPLTQLAPGESTKYRVEWFAACTGKGSRVYDCADGGVVCKPFTAERAAGTVALGGAFGVFYPGKLELVAIDADAKSRSTAGGVALAMAKRKVLGSIDASPLAPVDIKQFGNVDVPVTARRLELRVVDKAGIAHPLAAVDLK